MQIIVFLLFMTSRAPRLEFLTYSILICHDQQDSTAIIMPAPLGAFRIFQHVETATGLYPERRPDNRSIWHRPTGYRFQITSSFRA